MTDRPAVPVEVQREVLFESRQRCAVCCEPIPLELAHIIPWCETQDNRAENLIALCSNCHSRADKYKWGAPFLRRYKQKPCALMANSLPPVSAEQKVIIDLIVAADPESMTSRQRERLVSMVAAYAGVSLGAVHVEAVMAANSSRVRLSLPTNAAHQLVKGYQQSDPRLKAFLDDFDVLAVEAVSAPGPAQHSSRVTDTSEKGLETSIVESLVRESGYVPGDPKDYDRDHAVDLTKLLSFLQATQPKVVETLGLVADGPQRQQFLHRLQGEIAKDGVIAVFRKGIKHGPASVDLFYGTPSPGNPKAVELYEANIFSVTRQLRYSKDETQLALDLCLFINGLPVATFELKNRLTKQTVADAVQQYMRDRDPRELLFQFGRCVVHFAVDDQEVRFCTELKGKDSWFLPFNIGFNDGAGNPPNPQGLKTDYLWKDALTKAGLADILENYAQVIEETDEKGRKKRKQIFPRYHQLRVVHLLLAAARSQGGANGT